jgi:hypothetical protein
MKDNTAEFRFYDELNDFLPKANRECSFLYAFRGMPTVKAVIEAIGVPRGRRAIRVNSDDFDAQ